MRFVSLLLVLVSIWGLNMVKAQNSTETPKRQSYNYAVTASYYGSFLFYPGLKLGVEYPLWYGFKQKEKKNRTKTRYRTIYLEGNTGFYVHKNNHTGYFLGGALGYRKSMAKTIKFETIITYGYLQQFNAGETYTVNNDGSVQQVKAAGRGYFTTGFSLGFGQEYLHKKYPIAWHVRSGFNFQMPYNTAYNTYFSLEAGIAYYLKTKRNS